MGSLTDTTSREFFEGKYRAAADPWNFAGNAYELARYDALVSALGERRFRFAFEPGCSVGVLTEKLAERCERVLAMDLSETAVSRARERCVRFANVCIEQGSVAEADVAEELDLLVLSEIGYYFPEPALRAWSRKLFRQVEGDGVVVAVHWLGVSPDHLLSGDAVHAVLRDVAEEVGYSLELVQRTDGYRLDRWRRLCAK